MNYFVLANICFILAAIFTMLFFMYFLQSSKQRGKVFFVSKRRKNMICNTTKETQIMESADSSEGEKYL